MIRAPQRHYAIINVAICVWVFLLFFAATLQMCTISPHGILRQRDAVLSAFVIDFRIGNGDINTKKEVAHILRSIHTYLIIG